MEYAYSPHSQGRSLVRTDSTIRQNTPATSDDKYCATGSSWLVNGQTRGPWKREFLLLDPWVVSLIHWRTELCLWLTCYHQMCLQMLSFVQVWNQVKRSIYPAFGSEMGWEGTTMFFGSCNRMLWLSQSLAIHVTFQAIASALWKETARVGSWGLGMCRGEMFGLLLFRVLLMGSSFHLQVLQLNLQEPKSFVCFLFQFS